MELEETLYWLELLIASGVIRATDAELTRAEADQLIAIFVSLIKKWKP